MTYRRIIQLSPTTKVVSLPSDWLSKNRLRKGDSVYVKELDNALIIEKIKPIAQHTSIDVSELHDDILWSVIDAIYMQGYSDIELKVSVSQRKLLVSIVKFFPLFIIAAEHKTTVELKAVADTLDINFTNTLQRIRHITSNMVTEALAHIHRKDWDALNTIKKLDYTLNTYVSMCFRDLSSGKIKNSIALAQFVKILELYADRLCLLFAAIAHSHTITKKDVRLIAQLSVVYDNAFKLVHKFSVSDINAQDTRRHALKAASKKSPLHAHFTELTQSLYDLQEIIIQLHYTTL
ncbi:MAG: AbrB/MazE/SpoVT family DNA-binding domain-containing protein [Candidatus Woesearchaeota archaeon]